MTIHQPEHLPWLGLLDKVHNVDLWIVLDNVQYRRNYYQNRNKVRTSTGWTWLTVPVHADWGHDRIDAVRVDNHSAWQRKCWATMRQSYARARYFDEHAGFFEDVYTRQWHLLRDLNCAIVEYLLGTFGLHVRTRLASTLGATAKGSDLILSICQAVGASVYVSGISGRDYLRLDDFDRAGIAVEFQEFHHPLYRQCHEPFLPAMSSVDLLFNYGPEARHLLLDPRTPRMEQVFE